MKFPTIHLPAWACVVIPERVRRDLARRSLVTGQASVSKDWMVGNESIGVGLTITVGKDGEPESSERR